MARVVIPEADELLDKELPVLNKGFVRLVDYLGGDERVVQAARVSYGKGTKSFRKDKGLIQYLIKNRHTSPFEQVVLTFHVKLPIFVARQWIRHRTARVNEISSRYSVLDNNFYVPPIDQIRFQSKDNRQGRSDDQISLDLITKVQKTLEEKQKESYESYQSLIDKEISKELARINLPVSIYTQWYWQIDLHNLMHFLKLRLHPHAQWEIRQYAKVIARCAKVVAPITFGAFEEFIKNATNLSQGEAKNVASALTRLKQLDQNNFNENLEEILLNLNKI